MGVHGAASHGGSYSALQSKQLQRKEQQQQADGRADPRSQNAMRSSHPTLSSSQAPKSPTLHGPPTGAAPTSPAGISPPPPPTAKAPQGSLASRQRPLVPRSFITSLNLAHPTRGPPSPCASAEARRLHARNTLARTLQLSADPAPKPRSRPPNPSEGGREHKRHTAGRAVGGEGQLEQGAGAYARPGLGSEELLRRLQEYKQQLESGALDPKPQPASAARAVVDEANRDLSGEELPSPVPSSQPAVQQAAQPITHFSRVNQLFDDPLPVEGAAGATPRLRAAAAPQVTPPAAGRPAPDGDGAAAPAALGTDVRQHAGADCVAVVTTQRNSPPGSQGAGKSQHGPSTGLVAAEKPYQVLLLPPGVGVAPLGQEELSRLRQDLREARSVIEELRQAKEEVQASRAGDLEFFQEELQRCYAELAAAERSRIFAESRARVAEAQAQVLEAVAREAEGQLHAVRVLLVDEAYRAAGGGCVWPADDGAGREARAPTTEDGVSLPCPPTFVPAMLAPDPKAASSPQPELLIVSPPGSQMALVTHSSATSVPEVVSLLSTVENPSKADVQARGAAAARGLAWGDDSAGGAAAAAGGQEEQPAGDKWVSLRHRYRSPHPRGAPARAIEA